ncbi:MAG: hypothetical protein EXR92_03045 [Gemmatimonadetes bacterium]|nr:hypothetical protein [Gemmatimonadota bacterium]
MRERSGAALMLVLWLIVILGAICTEVVIATRSTTAVAANYRARAVARYAAESGVTVAVATLEDSLARAIDAGTRRDYLNHLGRALGTGDQLSLGDGRAAVALIDVGSRLDANTADAESLTTLFSFFTDPLEAANVAAAMRAFIGGDVDTLTPHPLKSLGELTLIPGVPRGLAERASEFLTVDGDGTINSATAPEPVLAAAGGELRDEPSRILVVSRGWLEGHPLTHEIQAVYAVVGSDLTLIRWREGDL